MEVRLKVLLVDDDPNKLRQMRAFLASEFPNHDIEERSSFQSGLKHALLENPDVMILDMTMPTYDVGGKETGGHERRYAGYEILRRLKRRCKPIPVIIVTQFERFGDGDELITLAELKERLGEEFAENFVGTVFYQAADAQWRSDLREAIEKLACQVKEGEMT